MCSILRAVWRPRDVIPDNATGTESLQTLRWSKGDSNSRSHRERSGHGRAPHTNHRTIARERSLSFRHLSSTARGTGSSNPLCSSGESRANLNESSRKPNSSGGPAALDAFAKRAAKVALDATGEPCPGGPASVMERILAEALDSGSIIPRANRRSELSRAS
jgi:hypothetical protein